MHSRTDNSIAARKAYSRLDNGIEPDDVVEDVLPEELDNLKNTYYTTHVTVTTEQADRIEHETREQSGCDTWIKEREKRITASQVGGIAKMLKTTKRAKRVQEMLYAKFRGTSATLYGMRTCTIICARMYF